MVTAADPQGWTFQEFQALIGGYVAHLNLDSTAKQRAGSIWSGGEWLLYHEEGNLLRLPLNPTASQIAGFPLVGPVLILTNVSFFAAADDEDDHEPNQA